MQYPDASPDAFEARKRSHITHSLDQKHQALGFTGLAQIHLAHDALPEIDLNEVSLAEPALNEGSTLLSTPFFIAGMTAGHPDAAHVNRLLAEAAARRGWAMGLGSQRRELGTTWKESLPTTPGLYLVGNLGLSQVITSITAGKAHQILDLVSGSKLSALCVHLNALQEAIQPEGTPEFKGGLDALAVLGRALVSAGIPLILKETGCGFSEATLAKLRTAALPGLAAIDVSGLGGTHWGRIEGSRAREKQGEASEAALVSETFATWGESTVHSVLAARRILPQVSTWASGGVRTGLDAAKLIALGAHRVGFAQPALAAALEGEAALGSWMSRMEAELKVALFCTGSRTPKLLREKEHAWTAAI